MNDIKADFLTELAPRDSSHPLVWHHLLLAVHDHGLYDGIHHDCAGVLETNQTYSFQC